MHRVSTLISRFLRDKRGSAMTLFAVSTGLAIGMAGLAVDASYLYAMQNQLQVAADTAAVAAVTRLPNVNDVGTEAIAFADANMDPNNHNGHVLTAGNVKTGNWDSDTRTFNDGGAPVNAVQVTVRRSQANGNPVNLFFGQLLGFNSIDMAAQAIAAAGGGSPPCLVSLDPTIQGGVSLDSNASITANGCTVQVNSSDPAALEADSNSSITADSICVNGDYTGTGTYSPSPNTNCAPIADPLGAVAPPPFSGCDYTNTYLDNANVTLFPGVYCGGLHIDGNSNVTLDPGVYVIKDADFHVDSNSIIQGDGVGFYLTNGTTLHFDSNTQITLSAPTAGPMAGLLVFQDRADGGTHSIDSNAVVQLEGAIYLPDGILTSDSNSNITGTSAYTIVIARQIILDSNATLVLNSDYDASDVPFPSALAGAGALLVN